MAEKRTASKLIHSLTLATCVFDRIRKLVVTKEALPFDEFLRWISKEGNNLGEVDVCIVFALFTGRPTKKINAF